MGLRKGQASKAFEDGKMDAYNFKNLPPEKLAELSRKGVEKREENRKKKKQLHELAQTLLDLEINSKKSKEVLAAMGIEEQDMTNSMLLLVTLFKEGAGGNIQAIRQLFETADAGKTEGNEISTSQPLQINIVPVSAKNKPENDDENW